MNKVVVSQIEIFRTTSGSYIKRETAKAFALEYDNTEEGEYSHHAHSSTLIWFPKSQCYVSEDGKHIEIPGWLFEKNQLDPERVISPN